MLVDMETVIHNIRDLSGGERSAAEQLVGHALHENQQLVIQVVTLDLGAEPTGPASSEGALLAWCHVYEGLTDAEIDVIDRSIVRNRDSRCFE
jgi:hypothetical protein